MNRAAWVTVTSGFAVTVVMFNNTSMNLALPVVAADLGLTSMHMRLVVVLYTTLFATFLIPFGYAADRRGALRCIRIGLTITIGAGVVGALADGPVTLLAARAVLGIGAALVTPASLIAVVQVAAPAARARAITVWTAVTVIGTALGQVLGGSLVTLGGWQSIFHVTVAGAALALAATAGWRRLAPSRADRLAAAAPALFALGLLVTVPALNLLVDHPLPAGAAVLVGLILIGGALGHPRRRGDLFGTLTRGTLAGQVINGAMFFTTGGTLFVLTQLLQTGHGFSPLRATLITVPVTVATVAGAVCAEPVAARWGARRTACSALVLIAAAAAAAAAAATLLLAPAVMLVGFGVGVAMPVATNLVVSGSDSDRLGSVTGANDTIQEVGFALGVSAIGTALAIGATRSPAAGPGAVIDAARAAYLLEGLCLAAAAVVVAALLRRLPTTAPTGAATNAPRPRDAIDA